MPALISLTLAEAALFEFDEPRLATELDTTPFVEGPFPLS